MSCEPQLQLAIQDPGSGCQTTPHRAQQARAVPQNRWIGPGLLNRIRQTSRLDWDTNRTATAQFFDDHQLLDGTL